jgi:hypothetical protein
MTTGALAGGVGVLRVTQWRVVRSEWLKLRSLRSSTIALGCAVVETRDDVEYRAEVVA